MHLLTQLEITSPSDSVGGFWVGFWIATVVILAVVILVGTTITLVNKLERQTATVVMHLSRATQATAPLQRLAAANSHLQTLARRRRTENAPTRNFGGIQR